jgi:hypothetical protein
MQLLKQSTAATVEVGPVLDANGDPYTGAVIGDFNLTKNGTTAAMAASATATHSHNGNYLIALTTGNTDTLGRLSISMNKATYAMTIFRYQVATANQFDALVTNGNVTPAAIADAVYDEPYAGHTINGTYGQLWDRWRKANPAVAGEVTAAITPTTTQFSTDITTYQTGAFNHAILLFVNGSTNAEINSPIVGYVSTNGVITLEEALPQAPSVGDEFVIVANSHVHSIANIVSGVWSAASSAYSAATGTMGLIMYAFSQMLENVSGWRWKTKALEQAPSGTSTVTVLPALGVAAGRGDRTTLVAYVAETITTSITVYQADGTTAYNLSGKTLAVIFENPKTGDDVAVVASGSITISGTDSNVVTFAYPSAATSAQRELTWTLRDTAAPKTVYLRGVLEVRAAATVDA